MVLWFVSYETTPIIVVVYDMSIVIVYGITLLFFVYDVSISNS